MPSNRASSRASDRARGHPAAGFTLIEMLVVLVVLGLLIGLVVGRGPSRSAALDLRAAAETVAAGLRTARSRAVATNRPVTVTLDPAGHTIRVGEAAPLPLPAEVTLSGRTGGISAIRFAPDGSATGGGFGLAAGDRRLAVTADWLTGRVGVTAVQ